MGQQYHREFSPEIEHISNEVIAGRRISVEQALALYNEAPLFHLSKLALTRKIKSSGNKVFYNRNFHIEPTNICYYKCNFCSFRKGKHDDLAWDMSLSQIEEYARQHYNDKITEIHLVGGVNPAHTLQHYISVIKMLKDTYSHVTIKAFSAIEHIYMIEKAGLSYEEGIDMLLEGGMDTITGGGAEIFDETVRAKICQDKASAEKWLNFHEILHKKDVKTTATMLYGHIETPQNRIEHLCKLRCLQDKAKGFLSFIPLKYRSANNSMSHIGECSIIDDLKTLAICRIFLDNIDHIKSYWPMYGKQTTLMSLYFGADDIDGTIADTTKIYSMAGVDNNILDEDSLKEMIMQAGFTPVVRDSFYSETI